VLGQAPLDDLLSQGEAINQRLQEIIDRQTEFWGVKVTAVEVKDVALPDSMKRAMANARCDSTRSGPFKMPVALNLDLPLGLIPNPGETNPSAGRNHCAHGHFISGAAARPVSAPVGRSPDIRRLMVRRFLFPFRGLSEEQLRPSAVRLLALR
jgi:hypothetical protein